MANEDGSLRIVFNGEIYNHAEIRAGARGDRAGTVGDRPLRHRGDPPRLRGVGHRLPPPVPRACSRLALGTRETRRSGSSATASASSRSTTASTTDGSTFASEIKALLATPTGPRAVDEEAFFHYLSFLTTPAPRHPVRRHPEAAGGPWLRVRRGRHAHASARWWDVWDHVRPADRRLRGRDRRARAGRAADGGPAPQGQRRAGRRVPVRRHRLEHQRRAVLGGRDAAGQDVLDRLRRRVRELPERAALRAPDGQTRWAPSTTSYCLTQDDLLDFLPRMVQLQDEPIADPVCVPVYYVSKLARDNGVIVCQVGEGADELFCGYPWWKRSLDAPAMPTTCPVPRVREAGGPGGAPTLPVARGRLAVRVAPPRRRSASPSSGAARRPSPRREKERLLSPAAPRAVRRCARRGRPSRRSDERFEAGLGAVRPSTG